MYIISICLSLRKGSVYFTLSFLKEDATPLLWKQGRQVQERPERGQARVQRKQRWGSTTNADHLHHLLLCHHLCFSCRQRGVYLPELNVLSIPLWGQLPRPSWPSDGALEQWVFATLRLFPQTSIRPSPLTIKIHVACSDPKVVAGQKLQYKCILVLAENAGQVSVDSLENLLCLHPPRRGFGSR